MDCTEASLSQSWGPQPVYSQVHSHSPRHKKWCIFHQDLSNSPHPYPGSLISKHTLECQRHLPFTWSISAEHPSLSEPLQQNVTISYLGLENKLYLFIYPPPPQSCAWGSVDVITFACELQMSLRLQPTNRVSFLWPVRLCYGVHAHDTGTEADVRTWIRMSQQGSQVWPAGALWNVRKYQKNFELQHWLVYDNVFLFQSINVWWLITTTGRCLTMAQQAAGRFK